MRQYQRASSLEPHKHEEDSSVRKIRMLESSFVYCVGALCNKPLIDLSFFTFQG